MNPDVQTILPCTAVTGTLRVPGDKSVSHRAAMLAAVAHGPSTLTGFLASEDCLNTLRAVARLGAGVERDGTTVRVTGTGGELRAPDGPLDLGNSGTGMRLLAGLLAGQPFVSELTGDTSLCSRPMARIRDPLVKMGATVELVGADARPPVRIRGGGLHAVDYELPVASAQVKSCVLLAGLYAAGKTIVREPKPTRDHTEQMLAAMGAPLRVDGLTISIAGAGGTGLSLKGGDLAVPGDFSSAAFWLAAAACREGGRVTVEGVGLSSRRTALLDVLERMGAAVIREPSGEAMGNVTVRGARLHGTTVDGEAIPNLIDELPLVAVLGACAEGQTVIREAAELRVKESDRIATTAALLRAVGIRVEEQPDGMTVHGGRPQGGVQVSSGGDHRIAMAAAVLGLLADGPVDVQDIACVNTSYPEFWDHLKQVAVL